MPGARVQKNNSRWLVYSMTGLPVGACVIIWWVTHFAFLRGATQWKSARSAIVVGPDDVIVLVGDYAEHFSAVDQLRTLHTSLEYKSPEDITADDVFDYANGTMKRAKSEDYWLFRFHSYPVPDIEFFVVFVGRTCMIASIPFVVVLLSGWRLVRTRRRRRQAGRCEYCDYDLRAATGTVCTECGTPIARKIAGDEA